MAANVLSPHPLTAIANMRKSNSLRVDQSSKNILSWLLFRINLDKVVNNFAEKKQVKEFLPVGEW
jgi:hypothetical protein